MNTAKKWAARTLGTAVTAGALLTTVALPAFAGDFVTAWGPTQDAAVSNAKAYCNRIGTIRTGAIQVVKDGARYKATIGCKY